MYRDPTYPWGPFCNTCSRRPAGLTLLGSARRPADALLAIR